MLFRPSPHIYTVQLKPDSGKAVMRPEFVREGFSLWAFIFGIVWTLYHRCGKRR